MSLVAELLDRLSGVSALRDRVIQQDRVLEGMQQIVLEHQRDIAELKGTVRALVALSSTKPLK